MKKVFTNSMVAHVWAQQTQSEGRNGKDTFYFKDKIIYSYGGHFPIAEFLDSKTVILSSRRYSPTTGRHQSLVSRAISEEVSILEAPYIGHLLNHSQNIISFKQSIGELEGEASRSLKYFKYQFEALEQTIAQAQNYCRYFKLDEPFPNADINHKFFAKAKLRAYTYEAQKEAKRKKEMEKARVLFKTEVKEWKAKNRRTLTGSWSFPVMLRLQTSEDGNQVIETSQEASIPVNLNVKRLWEVVLNCRKAKETFLANGPRLKIGYFQLHKVEPSGNIQIGCHYVQYGELRSIARQLNFDLA